MRIKNLFVWLINKKVLLPVAGLVLLFSVFPPAATDAFWPLLIGGVLVVDFLFGSPALSFIVDKAATPILEGLLAFFNVILGVIAGILQEFYIGVAGILHDIILYFIQIPVSPASQSIVPFVGEAFDFSRMFVGSLLILVLVFIGLATILRLGSYKLQKTLPLLLIVALLVNFSGVLVGVIADIGNILTNFFLNSSVNASWQSHPWQGIDLDSKLIGQNIARILFYIFGTLIYFIVMLLFGVRVIVLWTLSILAPFAFAALILPNTRGFWSTWFKTLVQWSIIGIPISFFLYLAGHAISAELPSGGSGLGDTVLAIFAPMSALFLLFIGIMLSMQFAPAGADKVIGFGKKWSGAGALAAGSAAWRFRGGKVKLPGPRRKDGTKKEFGIRLNQGIGESVGVYGGRLKRWGQREDAGALKERKKGLIDKSKTTNGLTRAERTELDNIDKKISATKEGGPILSSRVARFGLRQIGRAAELGGGEVTRRMKAKDTREILDAESEGMNKDARDNSLQINQEFAKGNLANLNRIAGLLGAMVRNGDSNDIQEYIREGIFNGEQIGKALLVSQRAGPHAYRPLVQALAGRLMAKPETLGFNVTDRDKETDVPTAYDNRAITGMMKEFVEKLTPAAISNKFLGDTIDAGGKDDGREFYEFGGELLVKHLINLRGGDLVSALARKPESRDGRMEMVRIFQSMNPRELYEKGASGIITYLPSNSAQATGVTSVLTQDEAKDLIKLLRNEKRNMLKPGEPAKLKDLIDTWESGAATTPPRPTPRPTPSTGGTGAAGRAGSGGGGAGRAGSGGGGAGRAGSGGGGAGRATT